MDEWLKDEILAGLQRLICLSLDRQPAADVLPGTAMTWYDALTLNRSWDRERDTQRIRTAFVSLTAQSRRWPAPADLIAALPPAPERKKIGRADCDESHRKRNLQRLAAVTAELADAVAIKAGSTRG